MIIRNLSNSNLIICYSALIPKTLIEKGFGLTILNNFDTFDGLLIKNCNIIHSFFMKNSFDLIFLNKEYKVIGLYSDFKPFKISKYFKKAKYVLEIKSGKIKELNINLFDKLEVKDS